MWTNLKGTQHEADTPIPSEESHLLSLVSGRVVNAALEEVHSGVTVGEVTAIRDSDRKPLVTFGGQLSSALPACSVVEIHPGDVGRRVVLAFENRDPTKPIIMGVLADGSHERTSRAEPIEIDADGERITVAARNQLVLRCGKASVTLTAAGKVLIQGTYISSRSSGVNRIKGGSVQLN